MRLYTIKKIIFRVTPPLLMDFIIYKIYKRDENKARYAEVNKADSIDFKRLYYSTDNPVLNISLDNIRHHGGQAYNYSQHHFMRYYRDGISALNDYYVKHQPKTIYEKHFIFDMKERQLNQPWSNSCKKSIIGEHGLGAKHGHSAFGPVSDEKIRLEAKRLDHCLASIKRNGYLIQNSFTREYNGFPRGYFLVSSAGDWTFRIVGAKHRVAAMAYLGWKNIPVCLEPNFPKCIFESDISNWPGVVSGEYTKDKAKLIFDSYFRDENLELWR
jgi:hypothetical protein